MADRRSKAASVTDRLTNTSGYTGAHKARFSSDGTGLGISGREDRVANDGYVASFKKSPTAKSSSRASSITDRLTNPTTFTGAHKSRFNADGSGRGIAGREDRVANDGYVASFKSAKKSASGPSSRASSITDRLTDSSKYTGAHKSRFNADGSGRGIAGRVDRVSNDGYVAAFKDAKEGGEATTSTSASAAAITDRLTDASGYTGAHKARFNADGSGAGKAGRVDTVENDGYVASYSRAKASPKAKSSRSAASITDRLTDSSKYTGAHKSRFTADGRGAGRAGRVDIAANDGYVGGYRDAKAKSTASKRASVA